LKIAHAAVEVEDELETGNNLQIEKKSNIF